MQVSDLQAFVAPENFRNPTIRILIRNHNLKILVRLFLKTRQETIQFSGATHGADNKRYHFVSCFSAVCWNRPHHLRYIPVLGVSVIVICDVLCCGWTQAGLRRSTNG
jgi:hypothetical protein